MKITFKQILVGIAAVVLILVLIRWIRKRGKHFDNDRFHEALRKSSGVADVFARSALRHAETAARQEPQDVEEAQEAAEAGLAAGRVLRTHFAGTEENPEVRGHIANQAALDLEIALALAVAGRDIFDHEPSMPLAVGVFPGHLFEDIAAEAAQLEDMVPGRGGGAIADRSASAARQRRQEAARDAALKSSAAVEDKGGFRVNRARAADIYMQTSKVHRSDSQNTHDSSVSAGYAGLFNRLKSERKDIPDNRRSVAALLKEVEAHIGDADLSEETRERARQALAQVVSNQEGKVHRLGLTDAEAFALVWERADHPRNAGTRDQIHDAVVEGLANTISDTSGHAVCNHGRAENAGGALATLDFDPANTNIMTFEQHRNDIFEKARQTIEEVAQAEAKDASNTPGFVAVARSYCSNASAEEALAKLDPKEEERFKTHVGRSIDGIIDLYMEDHPGAIPQRRLETLRADAKAALC